MDQPSQTRVVRSLIGLLAMISSVSAGAAQAPSPTKLPARFEVASIRPSPGTGINRITSEPGGRYLVVNFPLVDVIESAFDLRSFQLVDVPRWVQVERFDIIASTGRDEYLSVVAMRPLIQRLLANDSSSRSAVSSARRRRMRSFGYVRTASARKSRHPQPTAALLKAAIPQDQVPV